MSQNKKSTIVLRVYLILTLLLAIDCLLYYYKLISLRGYYSDVVLYWLWFLTSFVVIILFWKKVIAKLLLGGIILAIILSILPLMMPFYALILSTTSLGLRIDKNLNKNYRAQIVSYSAMAAPWLEVIEKHGLFEKRILKSTDYQLMNDDLNIKIRTAKDIIFNHETDSTLTLTLFYGGPNKTITFNKNTGEVLSIKNN
jgi:ABC-type transport system involved in multi-copper enzyme maturation permease subunit